MILKNSTIEEINSIPFFFIIGRPRTGTTLLQSIFDSHPNVIIPAESPVLVRLYNKFNNVNKWDENKIRQFIKELKKVYKIEFWRIDYDKLENDLNCFINELDIRSIFKILYLNFTSAYDKTEILLIGDKNPPYSKFPKLIYKIFPDAKFLIIHRDYRDHFLSMKKAKLMKGVEPAIIYTWKKYIRRWEQMKLKYPNQTHSFRYEDFILNPEKHLKEFCKFINIPFNSNLLSFYTNKTKALKEYKEKNFEIFHKNLYKPIMASNAEKWKKELSEKEIKIADYLIKDYANDIGYEAKYKSFSIKFKIYMMPRLFVLKLHEHLRSIISILPQRLRNRLKNIVGSSPKFYLYFFKK